MPRVSVIVPIYNGEATLAACLGNLCNQTLSDIEVVCVDDASTDGTARILNDAVNAFPGKVLTVPLHENKGPGNARNAGILASHGDYIGFCDCDDIVSPEMYQKLYDKAIETDADLADCAFLSGKKGEALIHISEGLDGVLDDEKRNVLIASGGYCFTKLIRRSILVDQAEEKLRIPFREVYALEDMDFMVLLLMNAKKAASVPEILYRYNDTVSSLSKEQDVNKYYSLCFSAMRAAVDRVCVLPGYSAVRDAVEFILFDLYKNICVRVCSEDGLPASEKKRLLSDATALLKSNVTKRPEENRFAVQKMPPEDVALISDVSCDIDGAVRKYHAI